MSHRLRALLVAGALLALMSAGSCGVKGQPCPRVGSVKAQDGHVYHCQQVPGGLQWQ